MGIPNKISPLTGGDILPRGYLPAEFLENTGNAHMETDIVPHNLMGARCIVRSGLSSEGASGEYYFFCTRESIGTNTRWVSLRPNIGSSFSAYAGWGSAFRPNGSVVGVNDCLLNYKNSRKVGFVGKENSWLDLPELPFTPTKPLNLVNLANSGTGHRLYYGELTEGDFVTYIFKPAISDTGEPCFYELKHKKTYKRASADGFIVGMTVAQARYLCQLPIVESGALTVSLPWEAQWDTGVQNALSIAATRGWTITVQYRDPEVATTNIPIGFLESNADSLIWFAAPTPATSAEIELDIQYTQTRESYQAACGIAGHTGNWVAVDGTRYMLYSSIEDTNVLERSVILYKWAATPDGSYEGQSSLSVQGTTTTSFARNTTAAAGIAMLNFDNGSWNPYYSFARVWSLRAKVGDWEVKGTPRLTTKGVPVMYDVTSKTEYPPTKGNNFIAGFDTAIQARSLAYLPDVTAETDTAKKSLTVSLPWDAQWDAAVQSALQIATDRDWTITVQYREPEPIATYMPISFLESTGTQYIKTAWKPLSQKTDNLTSGFKIDQQLIEGKSYTMGLVFSNNFFGLASTAWLGTVVDLYFGSRLRLTINETHANKRMFVSMNYKDSRMLTMQAADFTRMEILSTQAITAEINNTMPLFTKATQESYQTSAMASCRIWSVEFTEGNSVVHRIGAVIDSQGIPCMYDKVAKQSFYNSNTGSNFIAGFDTVEQARNISKLPIAESGALTVSFPWEAQFDAGVQAALQVATDRGWTITIQYRAPEPTTENISIGFLESTGEQYMQFPEVVVSSESELRWVQKIDTFKSGASGLYSTIENGMMFRLVISASGGSIYYTFFNSNNTFLNNFKSASTVVINKNYVDLDGVQSTTNNPGTGEYKGFCLFAENIGTIYPTNIKIYKFDISEQLSLSPALNSTGIPCMYDSISDQNFYNDGTGSFIAGFNTVEQALNLAKLPDVTAETDAAKKSLTVSLPWEAQLVITNVPAALQIAADRGWTITVQYREPEGDNAYYNKYAACETMLQVSQVNPDWGSDITYDGWWLYPMTNAIRLYDNPNFGYLGFFGTKFKGTKVHLDAPKLTNANYLCSGNRILKYLYINAPSLKNVNYMLIDASEIEEIEGNLSSLQTGSITYRSYYGCKLRSVKIDFPALSNAPAFLAGALLDKESTLRVLNSIPSYTSDTHVMTIGIHIDYQADEEVTTAIANAEDKGWTLTVQWNGTATAAAASISTFGLRSPAIYAKLGTMEHPDGIIENVLDWGHYVTNWEENGYQEFSSVEEAEEYFNINQTEEV